MYKNWYVVYTKPHYEKKLASLLTKKKIENFCPLNDRKINSLRRIKILREPLFTSYVFVKITCTQIDMIKQVAAVINILYWKNEPAVIKQDDIEAIKEFTRDHRDITLARTAINLHDAARVFDDTSYFMEGNVLVVKNKSLRVNLPSLGYIMTARIGDEKIFANKESYKIIKPGIFNKVPQF